MASFALLELFDSARFGPSKLPYYRGGGVSCVAFSSTWPSVDSVYPNQTSEPTRLPPIGFCSRPSWLSPTRLWFSRPRWRHLPNAWLVLALSFGCSISVRIRTFPRVRPRLLQPIRSRTRHPTWCCSLFRPFPAPLLGHLGLFFPSCLAHRGDATRAHLRIAATCPNEGAW